jgi:hypothetical protein
VRPGQSFLRAQYAEQKACFLAGVPVIPGMGLPITTLELPLAIRL